MFLDSQSVWTYILVFAHYPLATTSHITSDPFHAIQEVLVIIIVDLSTEVTTLSLQVAFMALWTEPQLLMEEGSLSEIVSVVAIRVEALSRSMINVTVFGVRYHIIILNIISMIKAPYTSRSSTKSKTQLIFTL